MGLDERRIRAQFMNNRAAEELARGRVDNAYWWLRGAQAQDPDLANLYNTLGVIRHRGALAEAERALQVALALDPGNEHVLGNLAGVQLARGQAPAPLLALASPASRYTGARQALDEGRLKQALRLLQGELGVDAAQPGTAPPAGHHAAAPGRHGAGPTAPGEGRRIQRDRATAAALRRQARMAQGAGCRCSLQ